MKNRPQIERNHTANKPARQSSKETAPVRIHTGQLVWNKTEFDQAISEKRFVTVALTDGQHRQLRDADRQIELNTFLSLATGAQLDKLRGTTPLYWTQFPNEETRPAELTALRGRGPGGKDLRSTRGAVAIVSAIQRHERLNADIYSTAKAVLQSGNRQAIRLMNRALHQTCIAIRKNIPVEELHRRLNALIEQPI